MDPKRCACCRTHFTPSRNSHQRYCSAAACQRKRRCAYQKKRLQEDLDYRENQRAAERNWHKRHPDYWRSYRQGRPEKMEINRIAQKRRDKKRRQKVIFNSIPMLATMYSFNDEKCYFSSNYKIIFGNSALLATIGCYRGTAYDLLASPS